MMIDKYKIDGLDYLKFLNSATRVGFIRDTTMWQETRYAIEQWCNDNLSNEFDVMLGEEDKLTDTQAHFVIYCLDDDIALVYSEFLPGVTPVKTESRVAPKELNPPEWLKHLFEDGKSE